MSSSRVNQFCPSMRVEWPARALQLQQLAGHTACIAFGLAAVLKFF